MRIVILRKGNKVIKKWEDENWTDNLKEPTKEDFENAIKVDKVIPIYEPDKEWE